MNLVLKGLVKLAISFQENDNFRNDLLLSYLSSKEVQDKPEVFDSLYGDSFEEYVFSLTQKPGVSLEELKNGRAILSYKSSKKDFSFDAESSVKM
jgi:hypothetical protein